MSLQQQYIIVNTTEDTPHYHIMQFAGIVNRDRNEIYLYQLMYHYPEMSLEEAIKEVINLQENHSDKKKQQNPL